MTIYISGIFVDGHGNKYLLALENAIPNGDGTFTIIRDDTLITVWKPQERLITWSV